MLGPIDPWSIYPNEDTPISEIPRTTPAGLESANLELHRAVVQELELLRNQDPNEASTSEQSLNLLGLLRILLDPMDQKVTQLEDRPCQGLPGGPKTPSSSSGSHQNVALVACDKSCQSDLVRVDNLPVINMWSPDESHALGKRNLPFCFQAGEDSLECAMESHEVDTHAYSPLLIGLCDQAKLGLIKDMLLCRCYIGDSEVHKKGVLVLDFY